MSTVPLDLVQIESAAPDGIAQQEQPRTCPAPGLPLLWISRRFRVSINQGDQMAGKQTSKGTVAAKTMTTGLESLHAVLDEEVGLVTT